MLSATCVALLVVHETPIDVGPVQRTVDGTVKAVMSTAFEFPLERVSSRTTSTTMITTARTPAAISQLRRRLRSRSS